MNDYKMVEDFKELHKQINEWKEQRGLTTQMQREDLIKKLKEEIMELIEAENPNEEMEVLCDISMFCIGALDLGLIKEEYFRGYSNFKNGYNDIVLQYKKIKKKIKNTNIFSLIFTCINTAENLGFDYFKYMQERLNSHIKLYDDKAKNYINIDTRIFNFIHKEQICKSYNYYNYMHFSNDFICITNGKSLLRIPCKNEIDKPFGLHFITLKKALKKSLANKGSKLSLELEFKEALDDETALVNCYFGNLVFECKKYQGTKSSGFCYFEGHKIKNKVDVSFKIFKDLKQKYSALCIRKNDVKVIVLENFEQKNDRYLTLPKFEKFNGLDKNKDFTLFYNKIKAGEVYKAVQDDVTLLEMGFSFYEKE